MDLKKDAEEMPGHFRKCGVREELKKKLHRNGKKRRGSKKSK